MQGIDVGVLLYPREVWSGSLRRAGAGPSRPGHRLGPGQIREALLDLLEPSAAGVNVNDVFLHLGAHKTATSYFQACLLASPRLFEDRDCRLVTQSDLSDELRHHIREWQSDLESTAPLPEYQEFLDGLVPTNGATQSVLLSFEGLIGRLSLALHGVIYPSSAKTIEALRSAFAGHRVRVGFAVRNYADLVCSTYSETINGSFSMRTFEEYLDAIDVPALTWTPVVCGLRAAFGESAVKVWSYEVYRQDPTAFNRELIDFYLGPGSGELLSGLGNSRVRGSTGTGALELQRRLNVAVRRSVKSKPRWREILAAANEAVRESYADIEDPPLTLPADLRAELDDRYRCDCQVLGIELPSEGDH